MSPSLEQVLIQKAAEGSGTFEDCEDLWGSTLTLGPGAGLHKGREVKIVKVDLDANTHKYRLGSGVAFVRRNDEDIYA